MSRSVAAPLERAPAVSRPRSRTTGVGAATQASPGDGSALGAAAMASPDDLSALGTGTQPSAGDLSVLLDTLDRAGRQLAALDVGAVDRAGRERLLGAVDGMAGALTAARGRLLIAVQREDAWRGRGDRDAASWRGRTSGAGVRAARAELRQAETMDGLPDVASAVEDGTVTAAHVDALSRATLRAPRPVHEALATEQGQAELVAMARRMDAETFGRAVARKVAEQDPASTDRSHAEQHAARSFALTDTSAGTRVAGVLDRMTGHRLRLALEALTPRPAADDERTHEQRNADALGAMADAVLDSPETAPGASVRPHVSYVMTEATWLALKHRAAARAEGATAASRSAADDVAAGTVTLEDGTPVPSSDIAQALCDCTLTRVVVDARSQPVDVGRTKRLYDGPLRRAIIARDRTCSWVGCDMHARWCEIHHIRWWDRDDGETSIENGVLLCRYHHRRVHEFHLDIRRSLVPPGEYASNGVAQVRYEFRTPDGRLFVPRLGDSGGSGRTGGSGLPRGPGDSVVCSSGDAERRPAASRGDPVGGSP